MLSVVPATLEYAKHVWSHMRASDAKECWMADEATPAEGVLLSMAQTVDCRVLLCDAEPVMIFGVAGSEQDGRPWALGTDRTSVPEVRRWLIHDARRIVNQWRESHHLLRNWVLAENVVSCRWLQHLGFDLMPPEPWGHWGVSFREFWRLGILPAKGKPCALQGR